MIRYTNPMSDFICPHDEYLKTPLSQDAKGDNVDLSIYKGKVLLIVNVASMWYIVASSEYFVSFCFEES